MQPSADHPPRLQTQRILPHTPWTASSPWSLQLLPLTVLLCSLSLFGVGEGMLVLAALGSTPWTVLAQGIAVQGGWGLGAVTFALSALVLLLWLPLRQKPGIGTILNMLVIALVLGGMVRHLPAPQDGWWRLLLCVGGVLVIGVASSLYLTCHLGAGPRDGLMVGLCRQTGWRVGVVRSLLEISVCTVGWLLGGTLGLGTLLFAFGVGWVVQLSLDAIRRYCTPPDAHQR